MSISIQRRQAAFQLSETLLEDLKVRATQCNRSLNNLVENLLMQALYENQVLEDSRVRMEEYCRSHFDESFVQDMKARDFLIGVPQPGNEADFEDIDKMFRDAEASGECTDIEVARMFSI